MTLQRILGIDVPIIQAPMAGFHGSALTVAVSNAGGLGSLPCATLSLDAMRNELAAIKAGTVTGEVSERLAMKRSFLSVHVPGIGITADQGVL